MRFRGSLACLAAALAALLLCGPSAAAEPRIRIEPAQFDPAIILIPPGTRLEWRNVDTRARALRGDITSPAIAPGKSFKRRFRKLGQYEYRDRANRAITGTVIVTHFGTGRPPHYPPPPRSGDEPVVHKWRGTLRVDLREQWKYMDGKFRSFHGPCNAEVGHGSRAVTFAAKFPEVRYNRIGSIEVLQGVSEPSRIPRYVEQVDAKASDPGSGRSVDCPDGSSDPPADVVHKCDHNHAGKRVKATLSWAPRIGQGRFNWSHDYPGGLPDDPLCGESFLAAGSLVGLDSDELPFDPGAGDKLFYDAGRSSPVTLGEARALRNGRPVTIARSFELHFTTDCCVGWTEPDKPTTYGRVGARYDVFGGLTIRLRPLAR